MDIIVYEVWDYGIDGMGKPSLQLATTDKSQAIKYEQSKGAWANVEFNIKSVVKNDEDVKRELKSLTPYQALAIMLDSGQDQYMRQPIERKEGDVK